jgi:hypothetical protein
MPGVVDPGLVAYVHHSNCKYAPSLPTALLPVLLLSDFPSPKSRCHAYNPSQGDVTANL